jgi:acetate kinase
MVCKKLGYLGVLLDAQKNQGTQDACITTQDSKVQVWRLKTVEESVVAACVRDFLHKN